jgi:hypothetical protein
MWKSCFGHRIEEVMLKLRPPVSVKLIRDWLRHNANANGWAASDFADLVVKVQTPGKITELELLVNELKKLNKRISYIGPKPDEPQAQTPTIDSW